MNRVLTFATLLLVLLAAPQYAGAQSANTEMREQFEAIIDGLNDNTFRKFHDAIDERAFNNRILGTRVLEEEARKALEESFAEIVEEMFVGLFPPARREAEHGEILGEIISFEEDNGQGRAIVRYEAKGYRYTYQSYDLLSGRGGRVTIVDWFDYFRGSWFSESVGNELLRAMPGKQAVAAILETNAPTDAQLFQVGELLKTVRDSNWGRYFQIHEGLEEALQNEPFVVDQNYWICIDIASTYNYEADVASREQSSDEDRMRAQGLTRAAMQADAQLDGAVEELTRAFPDDARHSLSLAQYYIRRNLFAESIAEFERFQGALGMKDGATEALKATSAMALGDFEQAQGFALSATEVEPTLELAWWTLLRARTAAQDYAGATEAMTQLEDRFGYLLIPQKLQRDRFLKILIDQQEYKDWRVARDQA